MIIAISRPNIPMSLTKIYLFKNTGNMVFELKSIQSEKYLTGLGG